MYYYPNGILLRLFMDAQVSSDCVMTDAFLFDV